ncbi:hypothetical protein [Rothia nasimurium]|uniref:hypothetical protein n=1 Tax=Rothia nasimurium TaxID=85336 RepID=UPI001F488554|nr:hypothetical protein [Rothia nasimurium]
MSTFNFSSTNPYEVLGLPPGDATIADAQTAYVNAMTAAAGDLNKRLTAKEAYQKVQTDIRIMGDGFPSAYLSSPHLPYAPQTTAPTSTSPVNGYDDSVSAQIASNRVQLEQLREQINAHRPHQHTTWGHTSTSDVYDAGTDIPLSEQVSSPFEVRSAPAFASQEFVRWETEFNQVQLERVMYPHGKPSAAAVFFCIVFGIFGVLGGFWGVAVSMGLYALATSDSGQEAMATNPDAWSADVYAQSMVWCGFLLIASIALFFVPLLLKRRRARKATERYQSLLSYGAQNGWLDS